MQLSYKYLLILVFLVAGLVVGAFILGQQTAARTPAQANDRVTSPGAALPPGHPAAAVGAESASDVRFTHFHVGNLNVKGMYAEGDEVWVGTSGGVIRYSLKTNDYKLYDVAGGSLLSNGVFHVSKLGERIAVGTYGGGLSLYDPKADTWKNINIPDGLADQFVYDITKTANGDVWIATWSGVNRVQGGRIEDRSRWTTFNVENTQGGLPNDWVYGVEEGKDGALWFATEQGVARFKGGQWRHWDHENGIGAPYEQVKGDIRFSSDPGKASQHHAQQKQAQGLGKVDVAYNPNYIVSMKVDRDGVVWAGTWGGGLARFDGKDWRNFTVKEGLPSNHVFMLNVDTKGQLWVGTSHGLARFNSNNESFTVLTKREGLFADNVFSMARAADGSLWVGSFGGVARLFNL